MNLHIRSLNCTRTWMVGVAFLFFFFSFFFRLYWLCIFLGAGGQGNLEIMTGHDWIQGSASGIAYCHVESWDCYGRDMEWIEGLVRIIPKWTLKTRLYCIEPKSGDSPVANPISLPIVLFDIFDRSSWCSNLTKSKCYCVWLTNGLCVAFTV